jgi:hypothetical protein
VHDVARELERACVWGWASSAMLRMLQRTDRGRKNGGKKEERRAKTGRAERMGQDGPMERLSVEMKRDVGCRQREVEAKAM